MNLLPFQMKAVDYAGKSVNEGRKYIPVVSPTGTGKSYIALAIKERLGNGCWIITPKIEIIAGFLKKLGFEADHYGEQQIIERGIERQIITPVRLKNWLMKGSGPEITQLIWDEVHHHEADTYQLLDVLTDVPSIGLTATFFRGTPQGTSSLRERWGSAYTAISYPEATATGVIQMPVCTTEALVDDDIITITNGEFQIESLESTFKDRLEDSIRVFKKYPLDMPTMVSAPSSRIVNLLREKLDESGISSVAVTQATPTKDRQNAFKTCLDCKAYLIQIDVVSEGIDLPIRRLLDMKPTLSPVRWQQQIGRIMRPGSVTPQYVCTNRNLMRHAYLLEGLVPINSIKENQEAFGPLMSNRAGMRAVGMEAIGRFKPTFVKTNTGITCTLYNLTQTVGNGIEQWAILLHPAIPNPLVVCKKSLRSDDDAMKWGKWVSSEMPESLTGFQSVSPKTLSTNQRNWWNRSARYHGLNETQEVNAKNFQVLPILSDTSTRLP